jgi:hypothetical protein
MLNLPVAARSPNEAALARFRTETITGQTTVTLTLSDLPNEETVLLFKNRLALTPTTDFTVAGVTITLTVAAVAGDVFVAYYHFRG